MAEEEVAAPEASPAPLDHKRKLEDLEPEAPQQAEPTSDEPEKSNGDSDAAPAEAADSDKADAKRPRVDEKPDGSVSENGHKEEKVDEPVKDNGDQPVLESSGSEEAQPQSEGTAEKVTDEQPSVDAEQPSVQKSVDAEEPSNEETQPHSSEGHQQVEDPSAQQDQPTSDNVTITRRVEVPNNKVGVLIGKAGDTIRYLQYNSGAKIQITRDVEADPNAATRPVEISGTLDNINKAERLISAVIAEADAGGSPSLVARGLAASQVAAATEQIEIQVANEKVGLIIGRGGETIKGLQARSGARIQLIPQHLQEGDESKERTVRVTGDKRQIEIAREMIKEVMNQTVRSSSFSSGFNQQGYRPRGPPGPPQWGPRGGHVAHQNSYNYHQRGPYQSHNQQYPPSYGGYPQQMGPRSGFNSGWEQRPPPSMHGMPQHGGGYDYYGQKGHLSDTHGTAQHSAPVPPYAPGPSPNPAMGPPQSQANYNYGQHQGPEYGHPAPYSQSAHPQQSYSHGYDDHAPTQHQYGISQPYPHTGTPTGYGQQQQYGRPPYGVPSQGPPPQAYGPPRPTQQPGDMPYQGSAPAQSYGQSVPSQQPYPYASSGPTQQAYPPYGSAPAAEGYNQPPLATSGYPQQGGQPVASYGQPGSQQAAGYPQGGPTAAYGQYPSSQQGYAEQSAPTTAGYGYQTSQDPSYGSAPASAYGAQPTAQAGYAAQSTQAQQSYDQSAQQTGAYGVQPSTTVAYGKTQSPQPQPGYAQYDSAQMYAAPH
ncbi:Far upstream element-binding protein 3 [Morus notabilis]|uniref:Far upstream element-binding protein 3 n=1 Tax=Morus notabilis TaxID=981085 RepID=W9RG82_9ROSA|nr:far upstream element-binding protein 1 isoform X2 [Morus notabilis]EXB75634.1 Far upstream element-binding protein 3 [Morus notabilis]